MPSFRYTARDAEGRSTEGAVEAPSADEARGELERKGYTEVRVDVVDPPVNRFGAARLDGDRVAERMADTIEAGLPLEAGLRTLAEETSGRSRAALLAICDRLDAGESPDQALAAADGRLPPYLRGLVRAGMATGRLGDVLQRYVENARDRTERRRRIRLGLAYPGLLLVLTVGLVLALLLLIVPGYGDIFRGFDTELPELTEWVVTVGEALAGRWTIVLPAAGAVVVLVVGALRTVAGRVLARRCLSILPIAGPIVRLGPLATFCDLLSTLVGRGVALPEALRLAGDGVGSPDVARSSRRAAEAVEQGRPPHVAARELREPALQQAFRWAENPAAFAQSLRGTARVYDALVRVNVNVLSTITGPIVILVVALLVGTLVAALLMPLIKLLSDLS